MKISQDAKDKLIILASRSGCTQGRVVEMLINDATNGRVQSLEKEIAFVRQLLDRWDATRSEMSGVGMVEGITRAYLKSGEYR